MGVGVNNIFFPPIGNGEGPAALEQLQRAHPDLPLPERVIEFQIAQGFYSSQPGFDNIALLQLSVAFSDGKVRSWFWVFADVVYQILANDPGSDTTAFFKARPTHGSVSPNPPSIAPGSTNKDGSPAYVEVEVMRGQKMQVRNKPVMGPELYQVAGRMGNQVLDLQKQLRETEAQLKTAKRRIRDLEEKANGERDDA
jgi:hypothetical protein